MNQPVSWLHCISYACEFGRAEQSLFLLYLNVSRIIRCLAYPGTSGPLLKKKKKYQKLQIWKCEERKNLLPEVMGKVKTGVALTELKVAQCFMLDPK